MVDEAFNETMGIRFKTKDMANQVNYEMLVHLINQIYFLGILLTVVNELMMVYNLCFLFQFFDDVRDVIRKAPAKELVDLPEGHDAKLGKTLRISYVYYLCSQ